MTLYAQVAPLPSVGLSGVPMLSLAAGSQAQYAEHIRLLFVIRESSTGAERELANLATDALLRHSYRSDVAELLSAGLDPLGAPTLWNGEPLPFTRGRGALVRVGNAWALFALSSAAKDTDGIQNEFTEAFVAAMDEVRPHVVVTTSVSRITRHGHHVSAALRSFTTHKPVFECDEGVLDFRNPHADGEFQHWASYAAKDRNTIVGRMEAGHRRAYRNPVQKFSFQGSSLPDGYRRTEKGVIFLEGEAQVEALREALVLLADPTVSPYSVAQHIAASAVFTPRRTTLDMDPDEPIGLKPAKRLVDRLLSRLEVYEFGLFTLKRTPVLPIVSGTRLHDDHEDWDARGPSPEAFTYQLPLPDGGWASGEVFAAIRSCRADLIQRRRTAATNPHKTKMHLPLVGYRWREGTEEWGLKSSEDRKGEYWLVKRTADPAALLDAPGGQAWKRSLARGWNRLKRTDPRFVCSMDAASLHRSIADTFGQMTEFTLTAAAEALNDSRDTKKRGLGARATKASALQRELDNAIRRRDKILGVMYSLDPKDSLRPTVDSQAREADDKVHRIEAALQAVPNDVAEEVPATDVTCDASSLLFVLARLRTTKGKAPSEVAAALQALLYGFTVRFDQREGLATWSAALALPSAESSPVAYVPGSSAVAVMPTVEAKMLPAVRGQAALRKTRSDATLAQAELKDAIAELVRRGLRGAAAKSLMGAPAETRGVVIDHLMGQAQEPSLDPLFIALVLDRYFDQQGTGQYEWNAAAGQRQALLDVISHDGPQDRFALMKTVGATNGWTKFHAQIRNIENSWLAPALVERYYEAAASKDGGQKVRVHARTCPHCGATVDIVARVRECPAGLLCSACLRMPVLDSPVFPRAYRDLAARPQRRRSTRVERPRWWKDLQQACEQRTDANLTVLSEMLDRPRWLIREALDVLGLSVDSIGAGLADWTDEALRQAYLVEDRRLADLADEIGISTRTLSKRLAKAGLLKLPRRTERSV